MHDRGAESRVGEVEGAAWVLDWNPGAGGDAYGLAVPEHPGVLQLLSRRTLRETQLPSVSRDTSSKRPKYRMCEPRAGLQGVTSLLRRSWEEPLRLDILRA